jgi:hypothetical protein
MERRVLPREGQFGIAQRSILMKCTQDTWKLKEIAWAPKGPSTRQDGGTARRVWSGPLDGLAVFWNTAGFAERQAQTHTFSPTDVTYLSGVFETVEGSGADKVAWE